METEENDKSSLENKASVEANELSETGNEVKRKRVRVKVRKRIRIKKKPSTKKLVRKIAERAFWTIIIVGFITSLIIMIVQLDIRDEKFKQTRRKGTQSKNK